MAAQPFVSFCFSTYKRPEYLKSTLQSILLQSYNDFEVIVSDNDTEGSGGPVVASFNDSRFIYQVNEENLGMKKSFNRSLGRASGKYIVMIADDDPVYPNMLETLVNLEKEFPGYGMYLGGCDWFCTDHEVGKLYNMKVGTNSCLSSQHDLDYKKAFSPGEFLKDLFSFGIFPHYLWSTGMVKKDILVKNGGVPEYGTPFLGDYAYMSANAADSGCVIINHSLGCQTLHNENFGRNQNEQIPVAAKNFPAYVEKYAGHLPEWPEIKPLILRFTALWVVSHMAFLHHYYKQTGKKGTGLEKAEDEVFSIPYVKKFSTKYRIKKNFPAMHDFLVSVRKKISS
jgi:glycosyltransferase involved in cell wall biosynthesis